MSAVVRVRRIEPGEGLLLKAVRLAALQESPTAFSSTLAGEATRSDEEWGKRAEVGSSGGSRITLFAEDTQGVVGLVGGYRATDSGTPVEVVSMWVTPSARRTGVGRALIAAVIDWARETGASEVMLEVTMGNLAAEQLYAAMGFTARGEPAPLPSNPLLSELRMAKPIV